MTAVLRDIIAANRSGRSVSIPSVCSAHPAVLRASLLLAETLDQPLVVEATSNQVNQFGGYTGNRPGDFIVNTRRISVENGVDPARIIFGGDHLGTQVWRDQSAAQAMANADSMIAEYAAAGFTKIHLDCSEGCAGEPVQLPDEITATRAAILAKTARAHAPEPDELLFVVGTEVPPPGGARLDEGGNIIATKPDSARATIAAHQQHMGDDWGLVGGLVVQPGVEFSPTAVHHLPEAQNPDLTAVLENHLGLTFEAHSTDYQHPNAFVRLAAMGFAFQKVGPALTHAWRRAVYALDALRAVLLPGHVPLADVAEAAMLADPANWQNHYHGDDLKTLRHFSLADRIRYYWPVRELADAVAALFADLTARRLPEYALNDVFHEGTLSLAEAIDAPRPEALALAEVQRALLPYFLGVRTT